MTRHIGAQRNHNANTAIPFSIFSFLGALLLAAGMTGLFAPQVYEKLFSTYWANIFNEYAFLLITLGIVFEAIFIRQLLNSRSKATKSATDTNKHNISESPKLLFDNLLDESKVDWSPKKGGGANFKTHNLVKVNEQRYEFKASTGMKIFAFVFAGFGTVFSSLFFIQSGEIIPSLLGLVFAVVGVGIYWFASIPRVFDKSLGWYWKGKSDLTQEFELKELKDSCRLDEIIGIQVISEYVRGDKSSYHSYEINLIRKDYSRINVVDHGSLKQISKDAEILSNFLNLPLLQRA